MLPTDCTDGQSSYAPEMGQYTTLLEYLPSSFEPWFLLLPHLLKAPEVFGGLVLSVTLTEGTIADLIVPPH